MTSEFPPQPGGIGNHAYNLALYLCKNQCQVSVIADQRDMDNYKEMAFDASLPFNVTRIPLREKRSLMYLNRVVKTFNSFRAADNVIATGKFSLWNVAFCSLFFKRHKIAVIHGLEVNFKTRLLRKTIDKSLKRFDVIIAVSEFTAGLVSYLEKEIHVIPNGIDLNQWQGVALPARTMQGFPVLTTIGRVSSRKGQLQVIKLLPQIRRHYPNVHYHCVGIPTEAEAFLNEAKALDVVKHVTFHGAVENDLLRKMLASTDVFVMLSKESDTGDVEGFGIAILEANAMGIPAIGSKGCGIEDAIKDGFSGFLIDSTDGKAFVSRLDLLLNEPQKFKEQAKIWAGQHNWSEIIKCYMTYLS